MKWKGILLVGTGAALGGYLFGQVVAPSSASGRSREVERELAAMQDRLDGVEHDARQQRRAVEVAVSSVHQRGAEADSEERNETDVDDASEPPLTDAEVEQEVRAHMEGLARAARAETPDRSWAPETERALGDGVVEASRTELVGVSLREVRCGSTKCTLDVDLPEGGERPPQSTAQLFLAQPVFRAFSGAAYRLEGSPEEGFVLRVVLGRAGHELEGVSRPGQPDAEGEIER